MLRLLRTNPRPQMSRYAAVRGGMRDLPSSKGLPALEALKPVRRVVLNYHFTPEGELAYQEITGEKFNYDIPPHHPALVWLAENRPRFFFFNPPGVEDVPGGVYRIRFRGDDWEILETPADIKWTTIR